MESSSTESSLMSTGWYTLSHRQACQGGVKQTSGNEPAGPWVNRKHSLYDPNRTAHIQGIIAVSTLRRQQVLNKVAP